MAKRFYQADVAESDTDSIWTGSIHFTETPEEAEFLTMLELQQDWGDSYMPAEFIARFGSADADEDAPGFAFETEFPGADAWNAAGYWNDLDVTTGMLVLSAVEALAQLKKIESDLSDETIDAVMTGLLKLELVAS